MFGESASIDTILAGLNQAQLHAVTNPAPVVQILAPPGSGKTRTLTARVAYLLASSGYSPSNVIVATFTVKAAREMKERIGKLIGNGLERKLILGTFHSIARRYLVRYGHLIGLKKSFGIADSADTLAILKRAIKRNQFGIDVANARSRISHIKAQGLSYDEYTTRNEKETKRNIGAQEFVVVYRDYQEALEQANLLDYDDLLLKCVELLKAHPEVTGNVEAVLVDEFQDTNLVQFDLMRGFAKWRKRVTIVGDPDQSIYGFRAAEIKNLKRMQMAYPDTLVVVLEENYRSSAAILQCAQMIIEQDESRPSKALLPTHQVGTKPVLRYLKDAGQEAQWIVIELKRVMAMTGNTITPNDVAILVRSASQTRHIEGALAQNGIAYKMAGGLRFFDRVEVKTVVDYLRVIHNPGNNDALARVVNVPPRKVGETTIKALLDEGFQKKKSLWDVIKGGLRGEFKLQTKSTKTAEQGLASFVNVVLKARKMLFENDDDTLVEDGGLELDSGEMAQKATLVDIVYYLMKQLKYREYLERHYPEDYDSRWANIEELVMQAADFTNALANTPSEADDEDALPIIDGVDQRKPSAMADALDRFLANVALVNEVQEEQEEEGAVPRERVTISTIHSAKGLEWPVVYIPGCYEGSIPHSRCDDTDEERRLLYVAMTRAMGLLYMSCPKKNSKYEKSALSQFIKCPNVLRLLEKRGPNLTPGTAQGLLHILGRVCPEIRVINEAAATLESLEDDLFPFEDTTDSDGEGNAWDGGGKRRKLEQNEERGGGYKPYGWENKNERTTQRQGWSNSTGVKAANCVGGFMSARSITTTTTGYANYSTSTTTMAAVANFSANTTSLGGFKSARGHLEGLREKKLGAEVDVMEQEMRRVHKSIGGESASTSSLRVESSKQIEKKKNPALTKKKPSTGQGNLLGFIKRAPAVASTNNETMKTAGSTKQQSGVRRIQAAAKDGFVLLSSSPVKRKSSSPHSCRQGSPSRGSGDKACLDCFEGESKLELKDSTAPIYIPDSEDDEDEDDVPGYLPLPLPSPPKEQRTQSNPLDSKPFIPNSDPTSDPLDPNVDEQEEEQAYHEIEPLHIESYEPVIPKPLLTRARGTAFMSATTMGKANQRPPLLMNSTTAQFPGPGVVVPEVQFAPLFNQAAAKVITQQQQKKKTLGIRRSMNGWESRGNKSGGGAVPIQRSTGAGVGKPLPVPSKVGGKGGDNKGGGIVKQLFG